MTQAQSSVTEGGRGWLVSKSDEAASRRAKRAQVGQGRALGAPAPPESGQQVLPSGQVKVPPQTTMPRAEPSASSSASGRSIAVLQRWPVSLGSKIER